MFQGQKSWTLHRQSFLGASSDIVTCDFTYEHSRSIDYWLIALRSAFNVRDARLTIFDDVLRLVFNQAHLKTATSSENTTHRVNGIPV